MGHRLRGARDTTILFTDIEGSTRLWEEQPERMSRALAVHDAIARAAVEDHGGIVVKTIGDGLYAAFADAVDGINAALKLQQGLADSSTTEGIELRARCGVHRGLVERRDDDYFGRPVNRTARIMSAAHGGQILVSHAVVESVCDRLPPDVTLRDLGAIRLKDLTAPERVFQLLHPALRQAFPALRSLEATPNNLPQQLTSFVGREREIAEARELLTKERLVTLLGMGGLGKTRLSLQIAAEALDGFPDGVWFVDLAPIRDASLVAAETAKTLAVHEEPGTALLQTLCAHVRDRTLLVIVDNCEHLVQPCAELVDALLRASTGLRILATTREALRIPGEATYPVLPLPFSDASDVDVLARSDAVVLFIDRARLHKPTFALTAKEAPAVAELCARLEGIPLALELAAARMRTLTVAEINARLRDRFKLLTGGGRVLLERQQTLRALVDWSYDLLSENERLLFDRLSVFTGGFEIAACEKVCGVDALSPEDILDLVTSLVDKSLVIVDSTGDTSRYRTLETIRDYARDRLVARGDFFATAARHCAHFLDIARAGGDGLRGRAQAEWTQRLESELDNLRAAIALSLAGHVDSVLSVKFEVALQAFWMYRGYSTEGRGYVRASLAQPAVQASPVGHAHALYVGAALAHAQGDLAEAAAFLEKCLQLRREVGNDVDIAATLSTLSFVRLGTGDATRAREGEEEALAIFRKLGDRMGEAIGLLHLGQVAMFTGDDAQAIAYFGQCLAIGRDLEHCEIQSESERMLGEIALEAGDVDEARRWFERSLEACRGVGDKRDEAASLWWMGKADVAAGDLVRARERFTAALAAFKAFGMNAETLGCLEDHAALALAIGDGADAARLLATVDVHRERLSIARPPRSQKRWIALLTTTRASLGAAFDAAWSSGSKASLDEAIRVATRARNQRSA
ncbi:MAG TPA: tetratricopeptide repeat protein [Casimicrobiaceae bacterium]|nr:tetratricopeptide repeat protein [Casimicrobiaceae bacterium]